MCITSRDALEDCHSECGEHSTLDYVKFGGAIKENPNKNLRRAYRLLSALCAKHHYAASR
jgi:hypothetical protein